MKYETIVTANAAPAQWHMQNHREAIGWIRSLPENDRRAVLYGAGSLLMNSDPDGFATIVDELPAGALYDNFVTSWLPHGDS